MPPGEPNAEERSHAKEHGEWAVLLKKILVPLDGSRLGESAVGYVERAADPSRTEIILLQVVAPVGAGEGIREGESSAYRGHALRRMRAERYLETLRKRLGRRGLGAEAGGRLAKMAPGHEELLENPAVLRQAIHLPLAGVNERLG
jgi:nucleotide-binding universal stress UspA family protein